MKPETDAFPRDELARLAQEFRHVRGEQAREGENGRWRRRLGDRLHELEQQLESVLENWVSEPDLKEAWRAHMHRGAEAPAAPAVSAPPWFVGRSDAGARLEITRADDGFFELRVDGQLVLRVGEVPTLSRDPEAASPASVLVDNQRFTELFDAGPQAVEALRALASNPAPPPAAWALELLRDGLIDRHFAITERGRRLLSSR